MKIILTADNCYTENTHTHHTHIQRYVFTRYKTKQTALGHNKDWSVIFLWKIFCIYIVSPHENIGTCYNRAMLYSSYTDGRVLRTTSAVHAIQLGQTPAELLAF